MMWPDAKWYFHEAGNEFAGVLDDYEDGRCDVLAIGNEDTQMDFDFLERMCKLGLVYTESVVAEIPVAFTIRPDLAAGFSYWMFQGERLGTVTLDASKKEFSQEVVGATCIFRQKSTKGTTTLKSPL